MQRRSFIGLAGTTTAGLLTTGATPATAQLSEPLADIEILTDEYGVSHIYADDIYSLAYGNGYVQARDRLFQIDALRLVGRGESAEWLGPAQLPSDIEVRRDLYSREEINRQWDAASETTKEALRGYADGVNRKMTEMAAQGELPGEFAALGRAPEPWKPEDSIAWINYAIGFFGVNGGAELSNAQTLTEMFQNFEKEKDAWEAYGDLNNVRVPESHYGSLSEDLDSHTDEEALEYDELPPEQLEVIRAAENVEPWGIEEISIPEGVTLGTREARGMLSGFQFGSNAIIVSKELSGEDKPILGAGPQMGLFKPPVPYEIGLHGAGFDVSGMGVSGAPALVIGQTPELAWTVTTSQDEMIDTIAVELDPDDRYRYKWDGEWHEMNTETVTHYTNPVGGALQGETDPNEYGVVRQEVARIEQEGTSMPVIAWNPEKNIAYCHRITTRMDDLAGAFMWAEVGRANSIDELEEFLSEFQFGFNFHVISDDEIAFMRTGKLPNRHGSGDARMPKPVSAHNWQGYTVGTDVVFERNPDRGYVLNWNNAPATGWRAGSPEQQWGTVHRVDVMERLMGEALEDADDGLTCQDVADLVENCSVEHPYAPRSVPVMIEATNPGPVDDQLEQIATELEDWQDEDYSFRPGDEGTYDNGGMAIWEETRKELQELVFRDKLGDQTPELNYDPTTVDGQGGGDPHAADHGATINKDVTLVAAIDGDTAFNWFQPPDKGSTPPDPPPQMQEVIREAMSNAAETLSDRYGSDDPKEWLLENRQSEFSPLGASIADRIPMSNRSSYPQVAIVGEGPEKAEAVLPPSNSGHQNAVELVATQAGEEPERLTNQLELYVDFEYKPRPVSREDVELHAVEQDTIQLPGSESAGTVRPVTDIGFKLLSVPGGRLRAVRDIPGQIDRSVNQLLDEMLAGPSGVADTPSEPESGDDTDGSDAPVDTDDSSITGGDLL